MFRRTIAAATGAATLMALPAAPATAFTTEPIDIRITIAQGTAPGSPSKVFVAEDVTIGAGPELTAAHLVEDDGVCGAVEVDIDPGQQTITFTARQTPCRVGLISFAIVTDSDVGWTFLTNDLVEYEPAGESHMEIDAVPADGGVLGGAWWVAEGQELVLSGATVLSYRPAPMPTEPAPAPTGPLAPTPPEAPAARPVIAQPTFTG